MFLRPKKKQPLFPVALATDPNLLVPILNFFINF